MTTMFMNTGSSKTSSPHYLVLNLTDKMDLIIGDAHVSVLYFNIFYTWKNVKK